MEKFESEVEQIVFDQLSIALANSGLTIRREDKWITPVLIRSFDMVIYEGKYPLVVIEVKNRLSNKNILAKATDQVRSALSITNSRFGIVTDSDSYYLYDRNEKDEDFKKYDIELILRLIHNPKVINISDNEKQSIVEIIKKSAELYLPDDLQLKDFIDEKLNFTKVHFNKDSRVFFLSNDELGGKFENQFFKKILGEFTETEICRFSSLKTIFDMISYLSLRMNGLAGMNDKSEVSYVESYFGLDIPIINEELEDTIERNKRYIASCTRVDRIKDLTLWRLYADDGQGVSLVFELDASKLNDNVFIHKVKYEQKPGKSNELEFLKEIIREVENKTGFKFEFKKFGFWKHFFKPFEYTDEEEVRILIIDDDSLTKIKTDWVMTYTHSIINPFIDFKLNNNEFPIILKKVILGPKCPEKEINKVQLTEMIRKKAIDSKTKGTNLDNIEIEISPINHYR